MSEPNLIDALRGPHLARARYFAADVHEPESWTPSAAAHEEWNTQNLTWFEVGASYVKRDPHFRPVSAGIHAVAPDFARMHKYVSDSIESAVSSVRRLYDERLSRLETALAERDANACFNIVSRCSELSGGYVVLSPEHGLPSVAVEGGALVGVHELVEAIDGLIDYDDLREMYPGLSYAQIQSVIAFLRKLAMINPSGWDADEAEDEALANDPEFADAIRAGYEDREIVRVLGA